MSRSFFLGNFQFVIRFNDGEHYTSPSFNEKIQRIREEVNPYVTEQSLPIVLFDDLALKNYPINSILIEGGLSTFNYFYNNKLFDEIIICQSGKVIKSSKKRYKLNLGLLKKNLKLYSARSYGEDTIKIYKH